MSLSTLSNTITHNLDSATRTQVVANEPFYLSSGFAAWDDNTTSVNLTYSHANDELMIQSTSSNAYVAVNYSCIPNSRYKMQARSTSVIRLSGGSNAHYIKIGTSVNDNSIGSVEVATQLSTQIPELTFNSGDNNNFWFTFFIADSGVLQSWDWVEINETGKYTY